MKILTKLLLDRKNQNIPLRGVIHIGAEFCQEWEEYRDLNVEKVLWIDGNETSPKIGIDTIKNNGITNQTLIQTYLSHKNGVETFYTTTNPGLPNYTGRDDSLLKPADIIISTRSIISVDVKRLDTVFSQLNINISEYNTLVIDVQGAEIKVLAGCGDILNHMDFVICETWLDNKRENYENQSTIKKMKSFMGIYEFKETSNVPQGDSTDILFEKSKDSLKLWRNIMTERKYLPTFAELIDRLAIIQLKFIFISENSEAYKKEMNDIIHDLDLIINEKDIQMTGDMIINIMRVMLTNRYIWENESKARLGGAEQDKLLKLTHSINGIRNAAKNIISSKTGERADLKIDCLAAELIAEFGNWQLFE